MLCLDCAPKCWFICKRCNPCLKISRGNSNHCVDFRRTDTLQNEAFVLDKNTSTFEYAFVLSLLLVYIFVCFGS